MWNSLSRDAMNACRLSSAERSVPRMKTTDYFICATQLVQLASPLNLSAVSGAVQS